MKFIDAKLGEVTLDFMYVKSQKYVTIHGGKRKDVKADKTICTLQIGDLVSIISEVSKYYKDAPNRLIGRKQAFNLAWKTLKEFVPDKEDRKRLWSEINGCGMKLV